MNSAQISPDSVSPADLVYVSEATVDQLQLSAIQCCNVIESIFLAHAAQESIALPATHLDISPGRGFRSLCAAWPHRNFAGNKWFGVRPSASGKHGEGVQALYMLNDYESGHPLAIICANKLTGIRTASMSALVLQKLGLHEQPNLGFIGCGLQASFHLRFISSLFPELQKVRCYSRSKNSAHTVAKEAMALGVSSEVCDSPAEVIANSQIIVSSIPLSTDLVPFLDPSDIQPGSVLLAVDLARPWHTEGLNGFDLTITDDHAQQAALPPISSKLGPLGSFDADLADVVTGQFKPFNASRDRAVFAFRGFSLADLAIASLIYERAKHLNLGITLTR